MISQASHKFKHYRYPSTLKDQALLFIPKMATRNALKRGVSISKYNKYNSNNYNKESVYGSVALYLPTITESVKMAWSEAESLKQAGVTTFVKHTGVDKVLSYAQYDTAIGLTNETIATFKDIQPRSFNFSYTFTPASKEESIEISNIVNFFRWHSLPDYGGKASTGKSLTVHIPAVWDLQVIGLGGRFKNTILFKTCVLNSVNVVYGENGYIPLMKDNTPSNLTMSLDFSEIKKPMKTDFAEWFKE